MQSLSNVRGMKGGHAAVHTAPLVTAVMVTGKNNYRIPLAKVALKCFFNQTYPNKELIIINHGRRRLLKDSTCICREFMVSYDSLGGLRNRGLQHARGEFVICWDDDDWYHPERMAEQLIYAQEINCSAVILRRQVRVQLGRPETAYVSAPESGHAGTILHRRTSSRYPEVNRSEDSMFIQCSFPDCEILQNEGSLYVRLYHGFNVWSESHIMHRPDGREQLTDNDMLILTEALSWY